MSTLQTRILLSRENSFLGICEIPEDQRCWVPMEGMRDLLRGAMGRSLRTMSPEDRLAVAWPVACGKAMAERGVLLDYTDGVLRMQVTDRVWLNQMISMRGQLAAELSRIAKVQVREIHFEVKRNEDR